MRILRICNDVPYPLTNGGRIETYQTTKQLVQRGHEVSLLAFTKEKRDSAELRNLCDLHEIPFNGKNSITNAIRGVIERSPINYVKWRNQEMLDACLNLLRTRNYDVVVVDHSSMGWYAFELRKRISTPIVTRWHDLDTLMWERWVRAQKNPLMRLLGWQQFRFVKTFEKRLASICDCCLTIGARDTEMLRAMAPDARLEFIAAGVDVKYYSPCQELQEPNSILFLASHYKWHATLDSVKWLYEDIMPLVWQRMPQVKLYITGKDTPLEMQSWATGGRVILTGFVPDERPVIAKASVVVVPVRLGAGIKIKLLTAFSAGKAVVSTSAGAEGLAEIRDGEHLLIGDTPESFAGAVVKLLENGSLRRRLEENGRALVCQHYDWNVIGSMWETALTVVSRKGQLTH